MYEIYAAGAAAAFTVDCLVYPLDTIKTRYQSQDFVKTYASTSGSKAPLFRGLYQGIGSVVLATLPAAGMFFATYESMKKTISGTDLLPRPFVHASASAIAEMGSCLVLAPAEVIKQNAQMLRKQDNSSDSTRRSTSLEALRRVTSSGAQRRLFSGYTALVARNLPFTAIQFPIFEHVRKTVWTSRSQGRAEGNEQGLVETAVVTGTSAGAAGAFAAFITTPSDVVKTRMMLSAGEAGDNSHSNSSPSHVEKSASPRSKPKRGSLEVTRDVYRRHGVRGLFRGGGLRAVWTAVGSGLYLGTYEMSKVWLTRGKDESEVVGGL
ncbi:hypothetical protein CSPX01_09626 [Colletotrichum filicis]|nr:hypothetical protein CSPX01_09626 [Colletotrichum filicis]